MKLSILIVSYNTRARTLECLESVMREIDPAEAEVLVYDNASSDGSAEAIGEQFPSVQLIAGVENLGFARGCNRAAERAAGEYLLFLNPDTVVLPGALEALLAFAETRPEAGLWGGRTLFEDGSLDPTSCWNRMTVWSVFCHSTGLARAFRQSALFDPEAMRPRDLEGVRPVDVVTGCFLLVSRPAWRDVTGFDEAFFMYGEEVDLCLRAIDAGYQPLFTPEATIVHVGGAVQQPSADKQVRMYLGRIGVARRHMSTARFRCVQALMLTSVFLRGLVGRLRADRKWPEVWRRRAEWRGGY